MVEWIVELLKGFLAHFAKPFSGKFAPMYLPLATHTNWNIIYDNLFNLCLFYGWEWNYVTHSSVNWIFTKEWLLCKHIPRSALDSREPRVPHTCFIFHFNSNCPVICELIICVSSFVNFVFKYSVFVEMLVSLLFVRSNQILIQFRFKYKTILRALQNYPSVASSLSWFTNCFHSFIYPSNRICKLKHSCKHWEI